MLKNNYVNFSKIPITLMPVLKFWRIKKLQSRVKQYHSPSWLVSSTHVCVRWSQQQLGSLPLPDAGAQTQQFITATDRGWTWRLAWKQSGTSGLCFLKRKQMKKRSLLHRQQRQHATLGRGWKRVQSDHMEALNPTVRKCEKVQRSSRLSADWDQ